LRDSTTDKIYPLNLGENYLKLYFLGQINPPANNFKLTNSRTSFTILWEDSLLSIDPSLVLHKSAKKTTRTIIFRNRAEQNNLKNEIRTTNSNTEIISFIPKKKLHLDVD